VTSSRAAWAWMLVEPIVHMGFMLLLYTMVRMRVVAGADTVVWLLVGLTTFFTARNIYQRGMGAISANQALFGYRQVLPVDTVLVRAALETFLGLIIACALIAIVALFGFDVLPRDPLLVLASYVGVLLCALGLGLILSVACPDGQRAWQRRRHAVHAAVLPVRGDLSRSPPFRRRYREWVFYNPFAHGHRAAAQRLLPAVPRGAGGEPHLSCSLFALVSIASRARAAGSICAAS
jgi:capsular polysaccharide transport system permease protein